MLDGRLAMRIAQQMLADGDVPSARESLESASISFNKAGEGRKREVEELEAQIAETALNSGRLQDAADMYKCTLQRAADWRPGRSRQSICKTRKCLQIARSYG